MRLEGKAGIVTGGAKGIGGAIVSAFAREGASVVIPDIDFPGAESKAAEVKAIGQRAIPLLCDVSDPVQVKEMVKITLDRFGKVDILVNNAATTKYAPFLEMNLDGWKSTLDLDLTGYFICAQGVAGEMVQKGKGKIINIASVAAQLGIRRSSAYTASKGGIISWTRVIAIELAPHNINVNCIAPGFIMTELARITLTEAEIRARQERIPLMRYGRPEDVVGAAVFLASADSDYITGTTIFVDGGFTCAGIL